MSELRSHPGKKEFSVFVLFISILVFSNQFFLEDTPRPVFDSIRYIHYGINLQEHFVFGLHKDSQGMLIPGNENTPLYPLLIGLAVQLDDDLKKSLVCLLQSRLAENCELNLRSFSYLQSIFVVLTLCCLWCSAYLLLESSIMAWSSALVALVSGLLQHYANLFMTEILIVFLYSASLLLVVLILRFKRWYWFALLGVSLGLLCLSRPEYHYLFLASLIGAAGYCAWQKKGTYIQALLIFCLAYYSVVGSWQLRNIYHFQDSAITANYGSIVLAYRTAYNRMSWPEWGVAFVYWFPDVGDSLAERFFDRQYYEKLGFDAGSYYAQTSLEILEELELVTTTPDGAMSYLLQHEILENIFKHCMVSLPIFWRGIFIGKYWGVLGTACFLLLLFRLREPAVRRLCLLSLPAWFLVALHAFVSVNVTRYNLVLLPYFAMAIVLVFSSLLLRVRDE